MAPSDSAIELVEVVQELDSERGLFVNHPRGERILDGVNLAVPEGGVTVLLGPSGAGKTVTAPLSPIPPYVTRE